MVMTQQVRTPCFDHDKRLKPPPETAVPYSEFIKAGFDVEFITERGNVPECDNKLLEGYTQKFLVRSLQL